MHNDNKTHNTETGIKELLKRNDLSVTAGRKKILELFLKQQGALSHNEIEKKTGDKFDRVTIYRTLQAFVKNGIAHAIDTANNGSVYALCHDGCTHNAHMDQHPHFVCENCKKITCCTDFSYSLKQKNDSPEYIIHKVEMTIKGLCPECAEKNTVSAPEKE